MPEKNTEITAKSKNPMVGKKVKAVPKQAKEIGIDTKDKLPTELAISSSVDISRLEGFSTVTQTREQIYKMIDTMSEDPILASYLKTISEDSVETNDQGKIIWCESSDDKCSSYVTYLLDSMNIDKNAFRWMHSLIKYGDLYLRLYRESDYEKDDIFIDAKQEEADKKEKLNESTSLKENVNLVVHKGDDHYVHYVEMVPNPGEMYELTKYGKTMGYIRAPINVQTTKPTGVYNQSFMIYKMNKKDVEIYSATDFVHGCLEDNSSRVPEEVDIFQTDEDFDKENRASSYTVKRGQSELASVFKIWRELSLLENSALLNRITKSSIIRTIQVEVGDMPKEQVGAHLNAIKSLMEQKTAINTGNSLQEYTNPGPVENIVYIPTREGIGGVTAAVIGGDFDPKQLTDISYFQDKLFGALGIPKAFFGVTDDGAGFNGGTSLAIQSSRYGKSIKRVQNTFCQMITDLINLMLLDKGLNSYINKFTIRMQAPVTQEELDRRENKKNRIGVVSDVMLQLQDVQNPIIKLKILKSLLSDSITDSEVIGLLQDQIEELENTPESESTKTNETTGDETETSSPEPITGSEPSAPIAPARIEPDMEEPVAEPSTEEPEESPEEMILPSPADIGQDFTDNSQF